jgi:TonB family protein
MQGDLQSQEYREEGLKRFVALSLGIHLLGFILSFFNVLSLPKPPIEEWSIDTELISETDFGAVSKTVIPKAKIAEEASVPVNQLPQLTKTFTIKEKTKEEEGVAEEKKDEKIETGKTLTKDTEKDGQSIVRPDVTVKLKKSEALERLVREKLKDQQKEETRELKAEDNSELAKIRNSLKEAGISSSTSATGLADKNKYRGYLQGTIKRNYAMPTAYQLKSAMSARIAIVINVRGELTKVEVDTSSGDATFDDYCILSVQKSSPFNPPPSQLAGELILLECKP